MQFWKCIKPCLYAWTLCKYFVYVKRMYTSLEVRRNKFPACGLFFHEVMQPLYVKVLQDLHFWSIVKCFFLIAIFECLQCLRCLLRLFLCLKPNSAYLSNTSPSLLIKEEELCSSYSFERGWQTGVKCLQVSVCNYACMKNPSAVCWIWK